MEFLYIDSKSSSFFRETPYLRSRKNFRLILGWCPKLEQVMKTKGVPYIQDMPYNNRNAVKIDQHSIFKGCKVIFQ